MSLIPSIVSESSGANNGQFKGTWNAATNTPTLPNPPTTPDFNIGDYYRVTDAGSQFGFTFEVGDSIIAVSAGGGVLAWDQDTNIAVPIRVQDGGTGATTAGAARVNLGLGALSTQNSLASTDLSDVSATAPTDEQVLRYNNATSEYEPVTLPAASGGDVTGPASAVDSNVALFDGTTGKIIKDGGALGALAALNSVSASEIDSGAVNTDELASNAVTTPKITDGDVTDAKLGTGINANKIGVGNVSVIEFGFLSGASTNLQTQITSNASNISTNTTNIAAKAGSGANSDITSISGLTTALSVAQGGTGGTTATDARSNLGLGSLATQSSVTDTDIAAGVNADKIANGTVSNTEFEYINSLTSNAQTQLDAKAPLASPALTGSPTAPTQADGDNSTKIATTAYVDGQTSPNNKGFYATPTALRTAYPTGQDGWYAIVGSTDTFWLWDTTTTDWKDSDTNSQGTVTSIGITGGTGVTSSGGPVTTSGSITIDLDSATQTSLAQVATNTTDIANNTSSISTNATNIAANVTAIGTKITASSSDTLTNKSIDVDNNTLSNVEVDNLKAGVLDTDLATVSASDDTLASAKAIKTYVDATAGGTGTVTSVDVSAGTGIASSGGPVTTSGAITVGLDSATQTSLAQVSTNTTDIASKISASSTDTLTNKTIDAEGVGNSITNLLNANIKAAAAIDATKLADGTITNTELQYINSLTSNAQTQLDAKAALASPALTGSPTAPTQTDGDNSTKIATTAYVDGQVSPNNKGFYATPAALRTAYPTGQDGWYAIVGSTDTFWVWDTTTTDWKDTDSNSLGTVTSIGITAGTGITSAGGPVTTSGSITVGLDSATQASLAQVAPNTTAIATHTSDIGTNTTDIATNVAAIATKISASSTDTLTNKSIDVDGTGNSITNIANANIKAAAAIDYSKLNLTGSIMNGDINAGALIDATKIADGSVTDTEFQYINTLSSNAQTQLDSVLATASTNTVNISNNGTAIALKAALASPTFTGTVTIPTLSATNTQTTNFQLGTSATAGYVMKADASGNGTWQADSGGGGTVTSITAGDGLSGGTITGSGTIGLDFMQEVTGSGSVTAPANAKYVKVIAHGGGGGGGGSGFSFSDPTSGYTGAGGGGGGAGEQDEDQITVKGGTSVLYYTCGSGGTGGSGQTAGSSSSDGSSGNLTSVTLDSGGVNILASAAGGFGGGSATIGTSSGVEENAGSGGAGGVGGGGGQRGSFQTGGITTYGTNGGLGLGTVRGSAGTNTASGDGGFNPSSGRTSAASPGGGGGGSEGGTGGLQANGSSASRGGGGGAAGSPSGASGFANGHAGGDGGDGYVIFTWYFA